MTRFGCAMASSLTCCIFRSSEWVQRSTNPTVWVIRMPILSRWVILQLPMPDPSLVTFTGPYHHTHGGLDLEQRCELVSSKDVSDTAWRNLPNDCDT